MVSLNSSKRNAHLTVLKIFQTYNIVYKIDFLVAAKAQKHYCWFNGVHDIFKTVNLKPCIWSNVLMNKNCQWGGRQHNQYHQLGAHGYILVENKLFFKDDRLSCI